MRLSFDVNESGTVEDIKIVKVIFRQRKSVTPKKHLKHARFRPQIVDVAILGSEDRIYRLNYTVPAYLAQHRTHR
ncbi:MAG: hypothetical protein ACI8Z1_002949 [Candidatus Azotimanducaceae bacterium]